jgi:glucokinase
MKTLPTDLSLNEKKAFALIRKEKGIVRSDIAKRIYLSASTADRVVQSLLERHLVIELDPKKNRRGRRGIALAVNPAGSRVISVELQINETVTAAAMTLTGEITACKTEKVRTDMTSEQILSVIQTLIDSLVLNLHDDSVAGIGFGDPGTVDSRTGVSILCSVFPGWKNIRIGDILRNRYNVPAFVYDVERIRCLAEARYGAAVGFDSFIYIDYADGIGMGVFDNGKPFNGGQGFGCEIGHMVIDPNGPICGCGGRGCLEAIAGQRSLVERAITAIRGGATSSIADPMKEGEEITAGCIFEAAAKHDRLALNLLDNILHTLGTAIGGACSLFNPSLVVLGGEIAKYKDVWTPIEPIIRRSVMPFVSDGLEIKYATLLDNSGVMGATEMVIEQLFYPPNQE